MNRNNHSAGFTLVELLVATTLLALLSVVLFAGLRFGARAWEAGGESIERTGEVEAVQELLRRTLSEAATVELTGAEPQVALAGAPDRVSFIAPLPRHVGLGGRGRYRLARDEAGHLLLAWEPHRPERGLGDPLSGEPAIVLQGVASLAIAYYGAERSGETPAWHDGWESPNLPKLIRIEVAFAEGDRRRWPELTIAPRLAHAAGG